MQISNILQQPAGMAVSKCINCRLHRAFDPFSQPINLMHGVIDRAHARSDCPQKILFTVHMCMVRRIAKMPLFVHAHRPSA